MSAAAPLQRDPWWSDAVHAGSIDQLVPAVDWWAIFDYSTPGDRRHIRVPVAAFALVRDSEGNVAVPLVAGDGPILERPDRHFTTLYREPAGPRCSCRLAPLDPSETDDVTWCPSCPGVIA